MTLTARTAPTTPQPRRDSSFSRSAAVSTILPAVVLSGTAAHAAPAAQADTESSAPVAVTTAQRTPAAPVASAEIVHTVVPGDTLSEIAMRYRVPLRQVFEANSMGYQTVIQPGQRIVVRPGATAPQSTPAAAASTASATPGSYTVQRGDGWWIISQRTGVSMRALQQANGMTASTMLHPNMVLRLSAPAAAPAPAPAVPAGEAATAAASPATPTPATETAAPGTEGAAVRYTVRPGDSLWLIGLRHEVSVERLRELNGLSAAAVIHPGQRLVISTGVVPTEATAATTPVADSPAAQQVIGNTFLHYTYPPHVTASANANYQALIKTPAPTPAQMQQIIRDTAVRMGVDPALALGHAHTESHFRHHSVSPANAIGAMQVIPTTGEFASQLVGRKLNLLDPYDNATAGIAYIRYIQANTPTVDLGIASYYQGLGGVRRDGLRPDTKNYVAKVKAAMAMF
ncbi:MAG: LysM peptidoglycan-binding domain-containing protein [Micrococcus sp.]|nr:LysM peptidoglycan-binding domain-containing protein [Micrococcus sp.]